jgi:tetratricopeptide (TPR) repeat protein
LKNATIAFVCVALGLVPGAGQAQQLPYLHSSIKDVAAWVREDTNDAQRQYALALVNWRDQHWRETDSLLKLAIRLDPRYADAYLALGFLPYARRSTLADEEIHHSVPKSWQGPLDEAERYYKKAFRTDPLVNLQIMGILNGLEEPQVKDFSPSGWLAYQRCCAWYYDLGLGRYRLASDRLTKLAEREYDEAKHPDHVPDFILWYRGLAAAHSLRYDGAIADFRVLLDRAIKKTERDEIVHVPLEDNEYRFILATLHHLAGHGDSAIALYQASLEHDLGLGMAHTYLANIYDASGRAADAMQERRRATEVAEDDPTAWFDLAVSLFNTGQNVEADEPLRRAIKLDDRFAPPYYLLGRVTEELGLPDEARQHYQDFLARASQHLGNLRTDAEQRVARLTKP